MSDDPKFHAAIDQEIVWKNPELQRFAVSLVRHALEQGRPLFTTDIVPDKERGDGPGIAGSVIELLKNANVIRPMGHMSDGQWYALRVKSKRPDRKSAWLSVYKLTNAGMAAAFLRRHGSAVARPQQQVEFFPQPTNLAAMSA
jgi:hypothetical protein